MFGVSGFGVWHLGFVVLVLGFGARILGIGLRAAGLKTRVSGLGPDGQRGSRGFDGQIDGQRYRARAAPRTSSLPPCPL